MWGRLLWGSWRSRRARLGLGLLAVSLGSATATALATLALQVGDDVARALREAGPNFLIQARGASWTPDLGGASVTTARATRGFSETSIANLKRGFWKNNILDVAPELSIEGTLDGVPATLVGTWFAHEVTVPGGWRTGLSGLRPAWLIEGRWPRDAAAEAVLGQVLARRLGARRGTTLTARAARGVQRVAVTGILSSGGPEDERAYVGLSTAQRMVGRAGEVDRIWMSAVLKPAPRTPPPDPARDPKGYERYMCSAYPEVVAADVAASIPGSEVLPATEAIRGEAHVVGRLTLLMVLLAAAAVTASVLGLLSTTAAAVTERARELALLRAVGASPSQLAGLLLAETAVVAIAGGLAGWAIGSAAAVLIRGDSLGAAPAYQPLLLPLALAVAGVVGLLGTLLPLRLALRIDPARVLRG